MCSINMAALHVRHFRRAIRQDNYVRKPRYFRDRSNPLEDLDAEEVFQRYRFRPETIMFILASLNVALPATRRNMPVSPVMCLLVGLRYLATGAIQLLIGDSVNLSRATAGLCIRKVVGLLKDLALTHVLFPSGQEAVSTKHDFFRVAGFPNVLGCIDGTFVKIIKPTHNEADFVNRKGFHALNVQMCCDARFRVISVNASWPGSVHDSRIFRSSALCEQFENGHHDGFLLGDSGYPCRKFLLTPFLNPTSAGEVRYNNALCRTRVLVEQTFGILKRRFQVLQQPIRTTPEIAVNTIIACVVLHNIGINQGDIVDAEMVDLVQQNEMPQRNFANIREDGNVMRRHIVENHFS